MTNVMTSTRASIGTLSSTPEARTSRQQKCQDQLTHARGQAHAERRTGDHQEAGFRELQLKQSRPPRAQGRPDCVLALAPNATKHQEIGDIRATEDDQHGTDHEQLLDHRPKRITSQDVRPNPA